MIDSGRFCNAITYLGNLYVTYFLTRYPLHLDLNERYWITAILQTHLKTHRNVILLALSLKTRTAMQ